MTPIERAARALYTAQNVGPEFVDDPVEQEDIDRNWRSVVSDVLVVIAAIREPSEAMASAAFKNGASRGHEDCWHAMVDALLSEGK